MKNIIRIMFCALSILVILGCTKEIHNLNNEFTLDFNRAVIINVDGENWEVKFIELIEDSRCKPGAYCTWAGQVAVKIDINNETKADIGIHPTISSSFQYKNYSINLLDVTYNKDKNFGKEKHCSIRLRVE